MPIVEASDTVVLQVQGPPRSDNEIHTSVLFFHEMIGILTFKPYVSKMVPTNTRGAASSQDHIQREFREIHGSIATPF
jgi:hypothetical protein